MFYLRRTLYDHAVELLPSGYLCRTTPVDSTAVCAADSAFVKSRTSSSSDSACAAFSARTVVVFVKYSSLSLIVAAHVPEPLTCPPKMRNERDAPFNCPYANPALPPSRKPSLNPLWMVSAFPSSKPSRYPAL